MLRKFKRISVCLWGRRNPRTQDTVTVQPMAARVRREGRDATPRATSRGRMRRSCTWLYIDYTMSIHACTNMLHVSLGHEYTWTETAFHW